MFSIDNEAVIWKVLDGEAVVIHSESAQYYGINVSGTALWADLDRGADLDALTTVLTERYGRPVGEAREAAESFVNSLLDVGLIAEGVTPAPTDFDAENIRHTGPYEPPSVVRFGDLNALVLSGE